jgi:hypothetical protein
LRSSPLLNNVVDYLRAAEGLDHDMRTNANA